MGNDRSYLGNAAKVAQGGRDIAAAGERLSGIFSKYGPQLEAFKAKKPWGNDDTGTAFEPGYTEAHTGFLDPEAGGPQVGKIVTGIGEAVQHVVKMKTGIDVENAGGIKKAGDIDKA